VYFTGEVGVDAVYKCCAAGVLGLYIVSNSKERIHSASVFSADKHVLILLQCNCIFLISSLILICDMFLLTL